jgi:hypothetical protein
MRSRHPIANAFALIPTGHTPRAIGPTPRADDEFRRWRLSLQSIVLARWLIYKKYAPKPIGDGETALPNGGQITTKEGFKQQFA